MVGACLALLVPSALAASKTWNVASGTWNYSTANWAGSATFAAGDDAIFSAGTADNATTLGAGIVANSLRSNGANTPATMTINGAASDILTLGTGTAGSGNIVNAAGTGGFEQNLSYNLAGANNALAGAMAGIGTFSVPPIGMVISVQLAHSLRAGGVNTLAINGGTAIEIRSSKSPGSYLTTGYAASGTIMLASNPNGFWVDLSQ